MANINPPITVGLRVDVDTYRGTRDGVPRLLQMLSRYGIVGSFFFSVGPDNMGRHLWRLFKPAFLLKMLRSNAASLYGWDIIFRGTLWPGPCIGQRLAAVIRSADREGHEVGLHAWDHHHWQAHMDTMSRTDLGHEIRRGMEQLSAILGRQVDCSAVAGWKCNAEVLQEKNNYSLTYNSDCRGKHVFAPVVDGKRCIPQIPVTLPTYDEIIGRNGISDENFNSHLLSLIKADRLNVLTIHAEVEGISRVDLFESFLQQAGQRNIRFVTLGELLPAIDHIPAGTIENRPIPGREGDVCWQAE